MVHRIQNRNPGYSDFSNLGSNTSFNFSTSTPISSGANALKLENEVSNENISETVANNNINQINDQYHEELLKNQQVENLVENTNEDDESSFTQEAVGEPTQEDEIKDDLKEFGVDRDAPDLFSSQNETSSPENLLSQDQDNDDQEDDLEIPAFLRRQKN
jgi:cell division protein FtsZ